MIGHHLRITRGEKSRRWFVTCECGWIPAKFDLPSQGAAMRAGTAHHRHKADPDGEVFE